MLRHRVLASYRRLLRVQRQTFAGDTANLRRAQSITREQYNERRDESDVAQVENALRNADDAAEFIRTNMIQAVHVGGGHYKAKIESRHTQPI